MINLHLLRNFGRRFYQDYSNYGKTSFSTTKYLNISITRSCISSLTSYSSKQIVKGFHTSSVRHVNPFAVLALQRISKVFAFLVGRGFRKWWRSLPKEKRELMYAHSVRNKWRYLASFFGIGGGSFFIYESHVSVMPYTERRRFMIFDSTQISKLSDFEFKMDFEGFKDKVLPMTHPEVVRTKRICERLLRANKDIPEIYSKFWTVSVVDMPTENCKVYPTGQIVMYKGMLELTDNDDQVAIILAHEISHVILDHSAELFNNSNLVECLIIIPLTLIWALLPNDGIAFVAQWFFGHVVDTIFNLPYSRMLEKEADMVGVFLAASACFDVREASAFWGRLDLIEKYRETHSNKKMAPEIAFFSTHPSNVDRQQFLDELMANAVKMREDKKCPNLSKIDPRESVKSLQEQFELPSDQRKLSAFRQSL